MGSVLLAPRRVPSNRKRAGELEAYPNRTPNARNFIVAFSSLRP